MEDLKRISTAVSRSPLHFYKAPLHPEKLAPPHSSFAFQGLPSSIFFKHFPAIAVGGYTKRIVPPERLLSGL